MIILAKLFIWGVTYQEAVTTGIWTYYETFQHNQDPIPFDLRDCGLTFIRPDILIILKPECL
jgi:hypothetical protein